MDQYIKTLEQYNDKAYVYSVLCSKASRYYNYWKLGFSMPIIITSTILTYINSNNNPDMENAMKVVNPVFNMLVAILVGIGNIFKFESKSNEYRNACVKFQKLSHLIENKILTKEVTEDFLTNIIQQYDDVQEDCMDIPNFICNNIRKTYGGKKNLPLICNGVEKIECSVECSSKKEFLNKLQE